MEFYEKLAGVYDELTRYQDRLLLETPVMKKWVEAFHIQSALDAAGGTGLHAVILAQLGVKTTGTDISPAMVQQAQQHARAAGVTINLLIAAMQELRQKITGTFDAIFCLGNSLPHLLTKQDLAASLDGFHHLLNTGGIAVIQNLNYDRVLGKKERIIGAHRAGHREFVRWYDLTVPLVQFNVLTIDWASGQAQYSLETTELYPYRQQELDQALRSAGFKIIEYFGDMQRNPFIPGESKNMVVMGKK
jgi:glycine/sarcosine N-methyltransferase